MANKEHIRMLKLGVNVWNQWRKDNPDIKPDLSEANLRYAELRDANLEESNLRKADLSFANLQSADICKADLSGAILVQADLRLGTLPLCLGYDELMAHAKRINKTHLVSKDHPCPYIDFYGVVYQTKTVELASLDDANLDGVILDYSTDLLAVPWSRLNFGEDVYQRRAVERGHEILPVGMGTRLRSLGLERAEMERQIQLLQSQLDELKANATVSNSLEDTRVVESVSKVSINSSVEPPSVFISYVRENSKEINMLRQELEDRNIRVFLDQNSIGAGADWGGVIQNAIEDGAFFLACFSSEYESRDGTYMDDEVNLAVELFRSRQIREPWLIPIKLSPCSIPNKNIGRNRTLRSLHCIDLYSDWTIGIKKLLEVIKPIPKSIQSLDGAEMVLVPSGEFLMGNDDETLSTPVHRISLIEFYMDVHPVTNAQYRRFVEETGHRKPKGHALFGQEEMVGFLPWDDPEFNADDQPVVCVDWHDAKAYAEWAKKKLPSEAQWEYAARGGMEGKLYPWGDDAPSRSLCSFYDTKDIQKFVFPGTQAEPSCPSAVRNYPPNNFGLFDMVGNVWEWCEDCFSRTYYRESPTRNPRGPSWGHDRVRRGGSWMDDASTLKVSYREHANAEIATHTIGFRCVAFK